MFVCKVTLGLLVLLLVCCIQAEEQVTHTHTEREREKEFVLKRTLMYIFYLCFNDLAIGDFPSSLVSDILNKMYIFISY